MKKIFIFVLLTTTLTTATAQTRNTCVGSSKISQNTGSFIATGKNISVDYNLPTKGGIATFTLSNQSGAALQSGEHFSIKLPAVAGYRYDLSNMQKNNGFEATPVGSEVVITSNYKGGDVLSFQCPLVSISTPLQSSPKLTFIKK